MSRVPRFAVLVAAFVLSAAIRTAAADPISVAWNPNPSEELVLGYVVSVETPDGVVLQVQDVGSQTFFVYPDAVAGQEYFFTVAAYNILGQGPASPRIPGFSNAPPLLVNPGNTTHTVGDAVALQLNGSDPYGEPVSYGASGLPPGVSLMASTGLISGTVTTTGLYTVEAMASDGVLFTSELFPWIVDGGPPALTITSPTTQAAYSTIGGTIIVGGTASDELAIAAVTWANSRGGAGSANGTNTWTTPAIPLFAGTNVITITVTDAAAHTATAALSVTNQAPAITNPGSLTGLQGVGLTQAVSAVDPEGGTLMWGAVNLPPGIAISTTTGMLSGTPTSLGSFNVTVSASDGIGTAQALFTWTIISPIPGPASPISPSGSIGTTTPQFSWTAVSAAGYYLLSIDDGSAAAPIHSWYTPAQAGCASGVGTCTVAAPRSLTAGLVTWMMLTWSSYGYGPWSSAMEAVVEMADGATPTPATLGPAGPIGTRSPSYSWSAVAGVIWYQLSITDALSNTKQYWYAPEYVCSASTCAMTPSLVLAIGPAQWQVRAWRPSGAGAWSTPVSFETAEAAPGKATLIAPSSPVPSSTPTFTWNAVIGTSYYLLRAVDRDNVEVEQWYRPSQVGCPLGTGTCSASPGGTIHPGPANWRVLTWNGSGYGPWSDPFNFTVEILDPAAGVPQTIGPNGAIATPNPTYTWTAVAGAVSYRLSVSNNGQPAAQWWFSPAAAGCLASAECTVMPQAGLQSGTATWRVQAWTVNGHGDWTAQVPLTVSIPAPAAPVLVSPNGTTTTAPQFVWNASPNATLYYVRAFDPTGLRVDRWLTPAAVGCLTGAGSCTMNAGVTLNTGAGSWEVIAWNSSGYSPWSSAMSFVVP